MRSSRRRSECPTLDGVAADADDVVLAGDGQVPAAPHEAHQHAAPADEVVRAPEAQDLGLPQMVHRADVGPTLHGMSSAQALILEISCHLAPADEVVWAPEAQGTAGHDLLESYAKPEPVKLVC